VGPSGHNLPIARGAGPTGRLMGMLLLALAGFSGVRAAPGQAPNALLLCAQRACQRGWTVVDSGPVSLTFERPLGPGPDGTVPLLRITASGAESPGGVTVSLTAQEVRPAQGSAEDVTQRYRDQLVPVRLSFTGSSVPMGGRSWYVAGRGPAPMGADLLDRLRVG
jgi:hypothetical protein